jgi:hypothetical protein
VIHRLTPSSSGSSFLAPMRGCVTDA